MSNLTGNANGFNSLNAQAVHDLTQWQIQKTEFWEDTLAVFKAQADQLWDIEQINGYGIGLANGAEVGDLP